MVSLLLFDIVAITSSSPARDWLSNGRLGVQFEARIAETTPFLAEAIGKKVLV